MPYDAVGLKLADGVGKWWEGMDPRMLYINNMREYKGIYDDMDKQGYNLSSGIFVNHLDFAHWYVTWWALRIMDVIENYDPDFIYTDGNSTQPFSGNMSGTGYKADGMQRVLAHYFNRTLQRRGNLDTFGVVKFNPGNRGIVNTFETNYPDDVKTDQAWIGETPIGDWYYGGGFNYDPGMVIRYLLECVSRDGAVAVNVALKPDGSLDQGSVSQLAAVGNWMISPTTFDSPLNVCPSSLGTWRRAAKRTGLQQPATRARRGKCPAHVSLLSATLGLLSLIALANNLSTVSGYSESHETS